MNINAIFQKKDCEINTEPCVIEKTVELTEKEYDHFYHNLLEDYINSDKRITALIEFDLDEGNVSICDSSDNAWWTYTLHDFSVAAYKAFRSDYRDEECRREIFNSSLDGKEVELSEADDEAEASAMQM